ncbi:hypothetical protein [Caballeronia zhejiangensis]|uniref:hypothetical protein n=1 Tax=Caballeronia zhejiangensis TaxID=871203 RepID=UPI00158EA923|nr:hypothetical protein [Caballeronia zhejiangensis]MCG7403049.1 hypothetical protein [Caballeronia zhejiangensis]MCI1043874.1 hypothetical protein [Caballeronia zhejiangensis]
MTRRIGERLPLHDCPWPGCTRQVSTRNWGCSEHWYMLPATIRSWIGRAYRYGIDHDCHPTRRYVTAHHAALRWIAEHGEH